MNRGDYGRSLHKDSCKSAIKVAGDAMRVEDVNIMLETIPNNPENNDQTPAETFFDEMTFIPFVSFCQDTIW
jgi:hypothetical protein